MSDPRALIRAQAKEKEGGKTTTKDKRIHYVSCTGDDDYLAELADKHGEGKQLRKTGDSKFGTARRLYNYVREMLIADRRPERPKQFMFKGKPKPGKDAKGNPVTNQHVCTVLVKENGYSRLDADTYDAVVKLVGKEWAENHITETIVATIDFSLCTKEKESKVFGVLSKLNEFVGEGFVQWKVGYQPNSGYHPARHQLTSEVDADLEELTPTVCSFGK